MARSPTQTGAPAARRARANDAYLLASTRPFAILIFLLPLIAAYELGSLIYLTDHAAGVVETISARSILSGVFEAFGALGFHLPAILLVVILLTWHILERDSWRVKPRVILGMTLESVLWTLPLLVVGLLLLGRDPQPTLALAALAPGGGTGLGTGIGAAGLDRIEQFPWQHRLTLSIGAGLYEELLFRLILISALHFLFADTMRLKPAVAYTLAAIASAVAFALYHTNAGATSLPAGVFAFYTIAGLYFAILFIHRGFGVVVATHALYDIVVLLA